MSLRSLPGGVCARTDDILDRIAPMSQRGDLMSYTKTSVGRSRRSNVGRRALSGDMAHGPSWYTAMSGIQSRPPRSRLGRNVFASSLGSLGDDPPPTSTLSTPTVTDAFQQATLDWQAAILTKIQAGATTLKTEELQRWLQIAATLAIPLTAAIWRAIFPSLRKRFTGSSDTGA